MPLAILPSFARGELAPGLYGRVDAAVYHVGLRTARNTIIHASGGVSNRPGLIYLGPVSEHTRYTRLIRFKFKSTDTYVLEFGNLYMRPIRNDAHVLEAAKTITAATAANPVVVTSAAHGYANGDEVLISGVVGMTQLNGRRFIVANKAANTFELTSQVTGANVDGTAFGAYTSGGSAQRIYEITTPYAEADLETIKVAQSADVMTLTHPSYETRELTRTAHDAWVLAVITFAPTQTYPTALAATQNGTPGTTEYKYKVTAIAEETFEESLPGVNATAKTITGITVANPAVVTSAAHGFVNGDEVHLAGIAGMTELNGRRFIVANKAANTFELKGENSTTYTAYASDGTATLVLVYVANGAATLSATDNILVSWTEAASAGRYAVYRFKSGLYGLIGETEETSFTDDGKTPDFDNGPPQVREPLQGAGNYPAAVSFYEQRRVFGRTNNKPDTSFYTQVGNFKNLSVSNPVQADDAITATLNSGEVNEIMHYIPLNDLLVLTSGEEWRVNAGGQDTGFSATSLRQKPQSDWGSGHQRPVVYGNTVIYVTAGDATVRGIGYSLDIDGYSGPDLSVTASHMFRTARVRDAGLAAVKTPDPLCAFVKDDGTIAVLTFQREQEVIAWSRWDTPGPGKFESVTSVRPDPDEIDEQFYFVVKRVDGDGNVVRYIERTAGRRFADVEDCFFVDSGLSYDTPVDITGITLANPCVVTAASHGFENGDEIDLHNIVWAADFDENFNEVQPDQLNGRRYIVRNKAANTFELEDEEGDAVDSSAYNAYFEGGEARLTTDTFTGLWHLEGQEVVALADGNFFGDLTVAGGSVTLPTPSRASRAHIGLRFVSDVETLDLAVAGTAQTIQGDMKHIPSVFVMMERSRGLLIGPASDNLTELLQRQFERLGEPTRLLTGGEKIPIPPEWNSHGRLLFRQKYPLPFTLLSVAPKIELEN